MGDRRCPGAGIGVALGGAREEGRARLRRLSDGGGEGGADGRRGRDTLRGRFRRPARRPAVAGAGASASRRLAAADESASGLLCLGFPCGFTREKPLVRARGKLPPPPSEAARLTSAASVRRRRMGVANCPGADEREGF